MLHRSIQQRQILLGNIASQGWLELLPIRFVTFKEMNLLIDSSDRIVWRLAQANQMMLLTANQSMKGEESLEQALREKPTLRVRGDRPRLLRKSGNFLKLDRSIVAFQTI
ncbi:MAG: hypothetical protein LH702_16225 [Phormidesmis sp. CAN_BIN44]|nr:hypothetical protein [Phormidesmis sp. CAN_BIN44]